jgi:hypothetical protein
MNKSPIKRVPKERVAILHNCTEKNRLERIELLLVGNGHPEDGYIFKVVEMGKAVNDINSKLTGISGIVKELHNESIGKKAVIKTDKELREEKRARITVWIKTASFIIGAISLLLTAYFSYSSDRKIGKPADTLTKEIRSQEGISKVSRGWVKYNDAGLQDSVKIK